jgi:hypothetical protein
METLLTVIFAVVTGYAPFSAAANHPEYWCADGVKFETVAEADTWVIDKDYDQVIVKAGAGPYANTIYGNPSVGEAVWADTDGNGVYDPQGPRDKAISHIIVCPAKPTSTPTPTPSPTGTSTPTPTATPTPTETPEPSESATPTPSQSSTPREEPITEELAGTGIDDGTLWTLLIASSLIAVGIVLRKINLT